MSRALLRSFLLFGFATILSPGLVMRGASVLAASTGGGCPPATVCDRALGVALTPPSGWHGVPPGHFSPHILAWFKEPSLGLDYNIRLLIGPDGTTIDNNDARAAVTAADELIAGYLGHVHPTRYPVRYGSAPGVLIRGLPGSPGPDAIIILAHEGALYSIIAPGPTLAPDQHQALASLRFIARIGSFPLANPPAPRGRPSHRTIPGGVFAGNTLTVTSRNGLHSGIHTFSLWFHARPQHAWLLRYTVPCKGARAWLVIDVRTSTGRVVDRVLHRRGRAPHVSQVEEIAGVFRLDVHSRCPAWSVTVSGIAP
jgi:hypothetical protein